ncbi:MAG: hypothetical protein R3C62_16635 [Chloroflexota bacterium]
MFFTAEDYWTSLLGYAGLPTKAGFWWTGYVVAALPSVGQIASGYIALALGWDAKEDRKYTVISILIWLLLFSIDAFTDMTYRMSVPNGTSWQIVLTAVFQTVGIFTIGSELSFVVGFGMTMQLLPEAVAQSMTVGTRLKSRMSRLRADMAEMSGGTYR